MQEVWEPPILKIYRLYGGAGGGVLIQKQKKTNYTAKVSSQISVFGT